MKTISTKNKKILRIISNYINKHGYSPTYQEIADLAKINLKAAKDHSDNLRRKGFISYVDGKARTIRVITVEAND
jgi:SOS-response transcriptional repressor LexA